MNLLTLYLEKIPLQMGRFKTFSVLAWADKEKTQKKCFWDWSSPDRPDKRNKTVMFNCYRWNVEWI
jgi:hypothetical protein